jgi:hypothetical protein
MLVLSSLSYLGRSWENDGNLELGGATTAQPMTTVWVQVDDSLEPPSLN